MSDPGTSSPNTSGTAADRTIRVGVNGAAGRMGATVCGAVALDPELELVAAVDPHHAGESVEGCPVAGELRAFADSGCDVVVDFTVAEVARTSVSWLALHGIHAVVGTTGLTEDDLDAFRHAFGNGGSNCLVAPNFALSAVLMMRFAEIAAPFFDTAEVIEYHHDGKVDAPSGTAVETARRIAAASGDWAPDRTSHETVPGARGGVGPSGVRVHSVRMRGMVAHQEVLFGALGQTLTIRQDSYDRASFMPGVLLACKRIAHHPGLTVGLDPYLDL
jgi:4-hydroxy-tetrahydrodipicolinate reductase